MTTPGKPVIGAGVLRYPQIMSPNFDLANPSASPANSWALLQNGLAYLFGVVLSGGTITGPDYIINTSGAFFYSGTPAAGNLAASIASAAGTDSFGNNYFPGFCNYSAGALVTQLNGSGVNFPNGSHAFNIAMSGGDLAFSYSAGSTLYMTAGGVLLAEDPVNSGPEAPHPLGAITATGYTSNLATYRLCNDGDVEFDIQLVANAGGGTAGVYSYANALPAAYRPVNGRSFPMGYNGAITAGQNLPALRVATNGLVEIQVPALPATTVLSCCQRMPLT